MVQVKAIGIGAPLRWLSLGWRDFMAAFAPCALYGAAVALISFLLWRSLIDTDLAFWALSLSCGFVFIAPMLAMGLYEAGRAVEAGAKPTFMQIAFVRDALRQDIFYLGLALLLIYLLWGRIAQIVYGLSTYRLHATVSEFVAYATSSEGRGMLIAGTIIGGAMAFFTFAITVVSTPMLLDRNANVFEAVFTSLRAVSRNFMPLLLWAAVITVLLIVCAFTAWLGLAIVFPWLGLASWRAYREIVIESPAAAAA